MTRADAPSDVRWLDAGEMAAWRALLEVGAGLYDALSADLRRSGDLTLEDYEVLHVLSTRDDRRLRVGALADELLASRTRLSQRLDRLGARGLVRRERCPGDGRAINVILTDAGHDLLAELAPHHLESARRHVFDHLDPADVDAIGIGLGKVARHLHDCR